MLENTTSPQAGETPMWVIGGGEGYGRCAFEPGATQREQWWSSSDTPDQDAVPGGVLVVETGESRRISGIVTVVSARAMYYADEGMSFGVGADAGCYFAATVRAATDAEAAPVLEAEARSEARRELRGRRSRLLSPQREDAQRPQPGDPELDGIRSLPQVPLHPQGDGQPYSDQLLVDEQGGWVWTVAHNGLAGDNFAANNLPGLVATRYPLTDERRELIADLRVEDSSLEEWRRACIPAEAAELLVRAGAQLHDVTSYGTAVVITDVEDACAYLARSPQQWAAAGWSWPKGRRWPAADAGLLADAGISHRLAEQLRAAGFSTVQDALAAEPPEVPDTAGRFVLRECGIGPGVQVADDPEVARQRLARDPSTWESWEHVPGVTVVHVAAPAPTIDGRPSWQLWSDGELTIGYWCAPNGREGERPRSLSAAAESALDLVIAADNGAVRDRALWQPLLTAVEHRVTTIVEAEQDLINSGKSSALYRHEISLADNTFRVLFDVVVGWWYRGDDGDAGEHHWISTDEIAAHRYYQEHRPNDQ